MKWVKQFYEQQFQMAYKENTEMDIHDYHLKQLQKLETYANKPIKKLLELGAGRGELAIAAANKGYDVTAIELIPSLVEQTIKLQNKYGITGNFQSICGDFYKIDLNDTFDLIYYIDGFGIGSDMDQINLLKRIDQWLNQNGSVLIDIYTPWYWAKTAGQVMEFNHFTRRYDYDFHNNRMLDVWTNTKNESIEQSLRCYAPADLEMLLHHTGLKLETIVPAGAMNYEKNEYKEKTSLGEAMVYMAKLTKKKSF